jgi:hypothetical protein
MFVVVIIAVFALVAVPRLDYAIVKRYKAETTAKKIVTDLRRVRGLAVANAANNSAGYGLLMLPPSPHTGYEIVETGPPPITVDLLTIDSDVSVTCPVGATFRFGPLGDLQLGSGTEITVSAEGKSFTITVVSATGAIKCVEN